MSLSDLSGCDLPKHQKLWSTMSGTQLMRWSAIQVRVVPPWSVCWYRLDAGIPRVWSRANCREPGPRMNQSLAMAGLTELVGPEPSRINESRGDRASEIQSQLLDAASRQTTRGDH